MSGAARYRHAAPAGGWNTVTEPSPQLWPQWPAAEGGAGHPGGTENYTLGLSCLFDEMADQGRSPSELLAGTALAPGAIHDAGARISHRQKVQLFRNVRRLSRDPLIGLRAGQRQRLSDFGVYGYALLASPDFGQAITLGIRHIGLAGPVLEKSFRIAHGVAMFEGHDLLALGALLPLVCEFWLSSMQRLIECVLGQPFQPKALLLPYPAPPHASAYAQVFRCPVQFDAGVMQWHFDAALLALPCPNANAITAHMCLQMCERMAGAPGKAEPDFVKTIRLALLSGQGRFLSAQDMAGRLHVSKRTLHRRLAMWDVRYQDLVDQVRRHLADQYLRETALNMDEIAERTGFADASNFRKAYRRWTGMAPSTYRALNATP